ncbi:MAG: hypothetical protein DRP41_03615 [Thermodesulfobacteriota bacterium]|nr:MAG: hypothetical protein DRP41_03615 [Thermodesulfobacteriota bacterium]
MHYLYRNPDTKDTLEGISRWWLLQERIDQKLEEVAICLDFLVSKGFIIEKTIDNKRKYYQLNKEKLKEISEILNEKSKSLDIEQF